jgi:Flp pilus assembly pilin Flp
MPRILSFLSRNDGQTMAEYAGVLAMITLAIITAVASLSGAIQNVYNTVAGII